MIRTVIALGLLVAPLASARAATITTDAFVATIGPTIEFLDASGRLALTSSDSPRVRDFARTEVASQDMAGERLAGWRRSEVVASARDQSGSSLDQLGPVAGLLKLPYDALANATSVASPPLTGLPSADRLRAAATRDLARLATVPGPEFGDIYASSQVAALERLELAYKGFILNGDDPVLRRLAVDGLPKVERLLARARRL